jgi:predicted transcriptional regulator of viral defense system
LFDRALDQYGYVNTDDARALGVPPVELRKLAARGGLEHIAYGVYRFENIPRTAMDAYMEAVMRVGRDAYLTGDAVLALHDLGQVNPKRIKVAARHRARSKLPITIELVQGFGPGIEVTSYEGIPSISVAQAIADCRGRIMTDRLLSSVDEAERRGLIHRKEAEGLRSVLTVSPS